MPSAAAILSCRNLFTAFLKQLQREFQLGVYAFFNIGGFGFDLIIRADAVVIALFAGQVQLDERDAQVQLGIGQRYIGMIGDKFCALRRFGAYDLSKAAAFKNAGNDRAAGKGMVTGQQDGPALKKACFRVRGDNDAVQVVEFQVISDDPVRLAHDKCRIHWVGMVRVVTEVQVFQILRDLILDPGILLVRAVG